MERLGQQVAAADDQGDVGGGLGVKQRDVGGQKKSEQEAEIAEHEPRSTGSQSVQEGAEHTAGQADRENIGGGAADTVAAASEKASTQVGNVTKGLVQDEQRVACWQAREGTKTPA